VVPLADETLVPLPQVRQVVSSALATRHRPGGRRPPAEAGSFFGPRPKNADCPLLKIERPYYDAEEGARSKGKQ